MKSKKLKTLVRAAGPIIRPSAKLVLRIFFDKKYLSGKHFDEGFDGYVWAAKSILTRSILRLEKPLPFPASHMSKIFNEHNICFHPDDLQIFQSAGTYFQNFSGKITIGKGCHIAHNVGIITANHDPFNIEKHIDNKDVTIGAECWIGMNSVILPGVTLGERTIVGAGSVVTKPFPKGGCVIAGNPAKIIKQIGKM